MNYELRSYRKSDANGVKELILGILTSEYPFDKGAYSDSDLDRIDTVYGGAKETFFVIDEEGSLDPLGLQLAFQVFALIGQIVVQCRLRIRPVAPSRPVCAPHLSCLSYLGFSGGPE